MVMRKEMVLGKFTALKIMIFNECNENKDENCTKAKDTNDDDDTDNKDITENRDTLMNN